MGSSIEQLSTTFWDQSSVDEISISTIVAAKKF